MAMVEYYPGQKKIFLSRLFEKVKSSGETSADLHLHHLISQCPGKIESVSFDVPLSFPLCVQCKLNCPGYESCHEPHIRWMWDNYRTLNKTRKPKRLFTPYTERCLEVHMSNQLEEPFHLPHALGSNLAPLTARAKFIARRLKVPLIEVYPKLSLWRIGRSLHVSRSHLLFHKHSVGGAESRALILSKLGDRNIAFLYEQDVQTMVDNNQAFEAFLTALTGVLAYRGQCEPRPRGFPAKESWLTFPKAHIDW